jgi:hypothetical protein
MKSHDFVGYLGLALLQFNCIPAIIAALQQGHSTPLFGVFLTIAGLACYLYHAVIARNMLYIIGNTIGLVGNSVLLLAILVN